MDIRQTSFYNHYLAHIGWVVERISGVNYFIKKFPLIGSIIKIQRPETIDFEVIEKLRKKYRAFQIILEPVNVNNELSIMNYGFRLSKSPYLPTKTLLIDISHTNFRSDIKRAIKQFSNDQFINFQNDLKEFRNAWARAVGLSKYVPPLKQLEALKVAFKGNSLFVTTSDYTAGVIFLMSGSTLYYWQAFSDKRKRHLPNQYRMVWYGILWGKEKGPKSLTSKAFMTKGSPINPGWVLLILNNHLEEKKLVILAVTQKLIFAVFAQGGS